jgi:hypothetical protein
LPGLLCGPQGNQQWRRRRTLPLLVDLWSAGGICFCLRTEASHAQPRYDSSALVIAPTSGERFRMSRGLSLSFRCM